MEFLELGVSRRHDPTLGFGGVYHQLIDLNRVSKGITSDLDTLLVKSDTKPPSHVIKSNIRKSNGSKALKNLLAYELSSHDI